MATALKKELENKKTAAARPGSNGSIKGRDDGTDDWKFINRVATMTLSDDGNKYVWCQHHGPNNGKSGNQTGMYMLDNQNHTKLLAKKKKKANA